MIRLVIFLLFLCPGAITASAQTLRGTVTEAGTKKALYPVTVVNLRTQNATYTSERGNFTISAEAGDKIAFSFIGYKVVQYQMPISNGTYITDITLERISYRLQEVILTPDYTPYQRDSIENQRVYKGVLSRTKSHPVMSPISFVAEKLNPRSRQIFRFQRQLAQWENEKYIDTRYTPELVYEMTGLSGDSLGFFMGTHQMPYDYARTATDLELKMWIRSHYREWLKHVDTAGLPEVNDSLVTGSKR